MEKPNRTYTCIAIDDDPLFLRNLSSLIHEIDWLTLLDSFTHPVQGATAIFSHKPDIVLVDVEMPHVNGFALLEWIAPRFRTMVKEPKVVIITAHRESQPSPTLPVDGFIYKTELKDSLDLEKSLREAVGDTGQR